MIIIEGCDGSGKSTLTRQLGETGIVSKVLNSPNKLSGNFFQNCRETIQRYGNSFEVAVDRFFFSELVYGPIIRYRLSLSTDEARIILQELRISRSVVIWCNPHYEVVCKGSTTQTQMFGIFTNLPALYCSYQSIFSMYDKERIIEYDWTEPLAALKLKSELETIKKSYGG